MKDGTHEVDGKNGAKERLLPTDQATEGIPEDNSVFDQVKGLLQSLECRRGLGWLAAAILLQSGQMIMISKVSNMFGASQAIFARSCFTTLLLFFVNWRKAETYGWSELGIVLWFGITDVLMALSIGMASLFIWSGDVAAICLNVPIPAIFMACLLFDEPLDAVDIALVFLNACGLVFVSEPSFLFSEHADTSKKSPNVTLGLVFAFSGLAGAVSVTLCSRSLAYRGAEDPCLLAAVAGTCGMLLTTFIGIMSPTWIIPTGVEQWMNVLALGTISLCAFYAYVKALETESVLNVAVLLTLAILLTYAYDGISTNLPAEWPKYAGVALILGSTFVLKLKDLFFGCNHED